MNIASLLDKLLSRIFLMLLFCYLYFRIFTQNLIVLSLAIITLCAFELLYGILFKPRRSDKIYAKKCQNALLCCPQEEILQFFCNLLSKKYLDARICKDRIVFSKDGIAVCVYVLYQKTPLCDFNVIEFCKNAPTFQKIYIFCFDAEKNAYLLRNAFQNKQIVIFTKTKLYLLMKKYSTFPNITKYCKPEKLFAKNILTKKNIKYYLFSMISILFFSVFSPFRTYYLIASCVPIFLIILTLISTRNFDTENEML